MNEHLRMYCDRGTAIALDTYNFPEDFLQRLDTRIKGLRYLLSHRTTIALKWRNLIPSKEQLVQRGISLFDQMIRTLNLEAVRELGDIIQMYGTAEQAQQIIDRMRELDLPEEEKEEREEKKAGIRPIMRDNTNAIFTDSQSVHNTDINNSVLNAASYLVSITEELDLAKILPQRPNETEEQYIQRVLEYKDQICKEISTELVKTEPHKENVIKTACEYMRTSVGGFGRNITLFDTFLALWLWIEKHKDKEELIKRLCEEIQGMKGMCSTGHLARLISVLQGFTDDPKLAIKISDREQCKNVVVFYLTKCLQNCTDDRVSDGMLDHNDEYVKFIRTKVTEKLLEWKKDYEGILKFLPDIVNNFAGIKIFTE